MKMVESKVRQPIISVLGHVDHGKTSLLDQIRGTAVAEAEPGLITQHIGATEVPLETIKQICGSMLDKLGIEVKLPGLLFIDTPGHEAFTNLRRRGGALADLAALVVDINEGFMPQTLESITILKSYKTPFMIAANKIDLLPGWRPTPRASFLDSFAKQRVEVQRSLDAKIYDLIGKLHELGFESERFDRVGDFRKEVSIVPVSARTGEGLPEVLAILAGLAQRFLEKELMVEVSGPARGTVLEVKEEIGLGTAIDVIIYDGTLARGDSFAVGGLDKVITSRVRGLFQPKPLDEIRDPQDKFRPVEPLWTIKGESDAQQLWQEMQREMEKIRVQADIKGVVLKADALGSLEAIEGQLRERGIAIRRADIGDVSRRDVVEASTVEKSDPLLAAVLAFNVKVLPDALGEAETDGIPILQENVIYKLIENYENWSKKKRDEIRVKSLENFIRPGKFALKLGFVFRRSHPAIVGVNVLGGVIKPKYPVMRKDGRRVGIVREIQREQKTVPEAKLGDELAVSIEGAIVDRNIKDGDVLYVEIPGNQVIALKTELKDLLSGDELAVLDEIIAIKQREDPNYGVM
jgi:translation initiation factor 5B